MAINTEQLEGLIKHGLIQIGAYSPAAVNLLMMTAAQESHMGTYIRQLDDGPALGIFQMEPATHNDLWDNYLSYRESLGEKILSVSGMDSGPDVTCLEWNLMYALLMARMQYRRRSEPLPAADDIVGLAGYWKRYYNTMQGAGTVEEAMINYRRFVLGEEE